MEDFLYVGVYIIQMSLIIRLWVLLGMRCTRKTIRSIIFVLVSSILIWIVSSIFPNAAYLIRYIRYGIVVVLAKYCFGKSWKEVRYDGVSIFLIVLFIETVVVMICKNFSPKLIHYEEGVKSIGYILIVTGILFVFILSTTWCKSIIGALLWFRNLLKEVPNLWFGYIFIVVIINAAKDLYREYLWENTYYYLFVVGIILSYCYEIKRSVRINEQKKALQVYQEYYPVFSGLIHDIKRKQHEFNNHLNTIYGLLKLSKGNCTEEVKGYMDCIHDNTVDINKLTALDNLVVAALVYSKLIEASQQEISFQYEIEACDQFPIQDYELVQVLGNLINNAFEVVVKTQQEKKHVLLRMGVKEDVLYIEVRNNGVPLPPEEMPLIFKEGYTTKGTERGYGLFTVCTIAKSKNGQVEVFQDNGFTVFRVSFIMV